MSSSRKAVRLLKQSAQAAITEELLTRTNAAVEEAAGGDPVLLFTLRRRLFARLMHWERSTPAERTKLKKAKFAEQLGVCAICGLSVEQKGSELDRTDPVLGYTTKNTRLVHHECHRLNQSEKGFR